MAYIKNSKDMAAHLVAAAYSVNVGYHDDIPLHVVAIAGASTAVKAIWATCLRGGPLKCPEVVSWKTFRTDKERKYLTLTTQPLPRIAHCLVFPEPSQTATYEVVTSLTSPSKEQGLLDVLRLYTPLPVLDGWAETLFQLGTQAGVIEQLKTYHMDWAYLVDKDWDDIVDRAARQERIRFDG